MLFQNRSNLFEASRWAACSVSYGKDSNNLLWLDNPVVNEIGRFGHNASLHANATHDAVPLRNFLEALSGFPQSLHHERSVLR